MSLVTCGRCGKSFTPIADWAKIIKLCEECKKEMLKDINKELKVMKG